MLKARSPFRALAKNRTISPPPPSRQGRLFPALSREPCDLFYACSAAAFLVDQVNSVPSIHMRCRMTASFRATATLALRRPFRLVSLAPQAFSPDHFGTRVSSTPAASNKYMRSMASPHFEIRPDQSTSPEAWRRVVNPTYAPTLLDRANRVGSSIVVLKQSAVIGPTPGTVMNLRTCTS